jgi:hypothetical protein
MITVLADHNIEGQAALLWSTMATSGWLELNLLGLATFAEVGLPLSSTDRAVWRFVQTHDMLLLTGNRNMDGEEALEQVIREENHAAALPVLTIGSLDRIVERSYREACADRLVAIGLYLDNYRGAGRIYLP